jgi:hypothetical protein
MDMPPADPTVLLSTAAQATAALVAIVGGFLVSRLVALSSERGSLVQRLNELEAALALALKRWQDVHEERFDVSRDWFVDHHIDGFIDAQGNVDIHDALADFIPRGSSEEEMRPVAEDLAERIRSAFQRVSGAFQGPEFPSGNLDHLRQAIGDIAEEDEGLYERVGAILANQRRSSIGASFGGSLIPTRIAIPTQDIVYQRQDARISEERRLAAEVEGLEHEGQFVRNELHRFGRPEGVGAGVAVLTFFSIVGMAFPMVLMSLRPVPDSVPWRIAAIGTFLLGLLVLLGYIGWLVGKLRPPKA